MVFFMKAIKAKNYFSGFISGFSLIEIMVVIAIMGVMAAIAMPTYQDYVDRAKISEGFSLAAPVQLAVMQYAIEHGSLLGADSNQAVGISGEIKGSYVENMAVSNQGLITIFYSQPKGTLELSPDYQSGQIHWSCQGGSLPMELRPSRCRQVGGNS